MKKLSPLLALILCLCMLSGCMGTPVIYHAGDCDCPTDAPADTKPAPNVPAAEGALKTGLAIVTTTKDSVAAIGKKAGEAKYDVTMVAVLVDEAGIIRDCIIDGIASTVNFDTLGQISTDLTAAPQTKNELGNNYGMVAWGGAIAEWDAQAKALADFAIGKTVTQLREGAIDETGRAPAGSDLASSATIYLGGYVAAIESAVAKAAHLGAMSGDTLKLAAIASLSSSKSASGADAGLAQLDVDVTALTVKDGTITACAIDSVQAKINFDATGALTSDTSKPVQTKTELGKNYGMVAWGGAIAEWDAQAAAFAKYVTGKTPAQVAGIAVNDRTVPTEADLTASVTIAVGGFQALIAKAAK